MTMRCISVFLFLLTVATAQQRQLTPADKVLWRTPATISLSPVSNSIAYTIREADTSANRWLTHIHLIDTSGNKRQLTHGTASCIAPAWSPDGKLLSFLSDRSGIDMNGRSSKGSRSLFTIPVDGGEAVLLASVDEDIIEYAWSPDGARIVFLTESKPSETQQQENNRRANKKIHITASSDTESGRTLWQITLSTSKISVVAELGPGVSDFDWFPDGSALVYQDNYTGEYNDEQKFDLWTITPSGNTTQLTNMDGPERQPRVSPDGRFVAFLTQTVPDIEFAKTEVSLLDLTTRNIRRVTAAMVHSATDVQWLSDASLVVCFNVGVSSVLYSIDTQNGVSKQLTDAALVVAEAKVSVDGRVAFIAEGVAMLREIYLHGKAGNKRLTHYSDQLNSFLLGKQETITIRSHDNLYDIEAILVTPPDRADGARVPLLLAYHGGPYGDFDNKLFQYYPAHILAAHGIATVMPNVRGSSGYSDEFGQANRFDLGGGDFRDAMSVVETLITRGLVDSNRMAVMGGSYGGYMTNWTISQTARFKAAVSMFGIFSWFTDWSNSWQPVFEVMYFGYNYWEQPLNMENLWINRAPQTYAQQISTPTLILQGDRDQYTNLANSKEMYQALKTLGCETEFVIYHGAGHGLRNTPNQWIDSMERSVQWICDRIATP